MKHAHHCLRWKKVQCWKLLFFFALQWCYLRGWGRTHLRILARIPGPCVLQSVDFDFVWFWYRWRPADGWRINPTDDAHTHREEAFMTTTKEQHLCRSLFKVQSCSYFSCTPFLGATTATNELLHMNSKAMLLRQGNVLEMQFRWKLENNHQRGEHSLTEKASPSMK